jgi:4-hydroxy-2-oxoheptanedioate aldolase
VHNVIANGDLKGIRSQNRLKSQLRQGQPTFGVTLAIGHPEVSYALGNLGLDWINFDMQHGILDIRTVAVMIQAISYSQTVPIVRVPSNELGVINKALDFGACGVIVPLVNSREDAEKAVRSSRYAPKGTRSWGQRAALRDPDYSFTADAEIMVIPQIETELALHNLEEIVCTDGVEAVFCGPYDLSMSLGIFCQFDNPKFVKALELIVSTCRAHGVAPGLLAPIGSIERSLRLGFKLISLGGDLSMLVNSIAKALETARNATKL